MNNIVYYDVCAIVLISILMVVVIKKRNIDIVRNRLLFALMVVTWISALGDLVAAVAENTDIVTDSAIRLAYAANYVYFFNHNLILPVYILYIYSSLGISFVFNRRPVSRATWAILVLVSGCVLLSNRYTHSVFYITEDAKYCRGPLLVVFYIVAAVFVGWGFSALVFYRRIVDKEKLIVLLSTFIAMLGAILIQFFFPTMLVESFTISIEMLIFIIVIHRNENPIDPVSGAMKYHRAIERVSVALQLNRHFNAIFVNLNNSKNIQLYLGQERFVKYLNEQTNMIKTIAKGMNYPIEIFYLENAEYGIFSNDTDKEKAMEFARLLYKYYEERCEIDHLAILPEASICVVRCPEDIDDAYKLVSLSTSFYNTFGAKKGVIAYEDVVKDREFAIRNDLDVILKRAIEEKRFEVYYQPIYSVVKKKFISAEALIRLRDEKYGYISPALFIPYAEKHGLIHEIGDFVLEDVIKFISGINMDELSLEYIHINMSAAQCIEVGLVDKVKGLLDRYKVSSERLCMELTETVADVNPVIADENVRALSELGIRFSLDDYGMGYSNIQRVASLPLDQVKLDKSFVDAVDNPVMWNVIEHTITMFKEMGKEILIEGIEQENVAKKFADVKIDLLQGCELMQGFYFCRPMPAIEFVEFIKANLNRKFLN